MKRRSLTLILLTWTIWGAPTNASKWRMGFNSAFKGLIKMSFCLPNCTTSLTVLSLRKCAQCSGRPKWHCVLKDPRPRPLVLPYNSSIKRQMSEWSIGGMILTRENRSTGGKKSVPVPFNHHKSHLEWPRIEPGTAV
jgi:hypothetical protein